MNALAQRLLRARRDAGLTQEELAERIGVSDRLIRYYETGIKAPKLDRLRRFARATGKSVSWLIGEGGFDARIPFYDDIPAGPLQDVPSARQDYVTAPPNWTQDQEAYALRVRGRSMEPALQEGDVIIVRRQNQATAGQIVVVSVEGDDPAGRYTVKRLARQGRRWVLRADNPAFQGDVPSGPFTVDGVVVGMLREFEADRKRPAASE